MFKRAAAVLLASATVLVLSNEASEARFRVRLGSSPARAAPAPMSKPALAPNAAPAAARPGYGGLYVGVSVSPRPAGAGLYRDVPASSNAPAAGFAGPLQFDPDASIADVTDQPPAQPVAQQAPAEIATPPAPAMQTAPMIVSAAYPPVQRAAAPAKPVGRIVYCAVQANGACAPF